MAQASRRATKTKKQTKTAIKSSTDTIKLTNENKPTNNEESNENDLTNSESTDENKLITNIKPEVKSSIKPSVKTSIKASIKSPSVKPSVKASIKSPSTKSKKSKSTNKTTKKKNEFDKSTNHLITEYYKVTRRKTTKTLKEEQDQLITHFIKNDVDDEKSLKIEEFKDKGRGILTCKKYTKGSFICEYRGDLIDIQEAKTREKLYESQQLGCYMYYFLWSNKQWCIDATADTGRLGRLINHSRKRPNLKTKLFILNNIPHLIFVALDDIEENTELLYDYGETNRCAIEAHPWIKNT